MWVRMGTVTRGQLAPPEARGPGSEVLLLGCWVSGVPGKATQKCRALRWEGQWVGNGLPGASAGEAGEQEQGFTRTSPFLPQGQLMVWRVWTRDVARLSGPCGLQGARPGPCVEEAVDYVAIQWQTRHQSHGSILAGGLSYLTQGLLPKYPLWASLG